LYDEFLTADEIQSLLDNKDMWMDVDEVFIRMERRSKAMQELYELEEATRPD